MAKSDYFAVLSESENVVIINKSRFITTLIPIVGYDDAIEKIKTVAKKYGDATHNCYAFISNELATQQRFSDDGEPQGTAGIPMLEALKKRKVYMTLAVVTRYFGGVKLGANGLVGAYSNSVREALDKADVAHMVYSDVISVKLPYGAYRKVEEACVKYGGRVESAEYGDDVTLLIAIPENKSKDFMEKIVNITSDKAKITHTKSHFVAYESNRSK